MEANLKVGTEVTSVTVEAKGGDLVENDSTFHTDVDRDLFKNVPLESASSEVSSLVTLTTPGVAADSNGLFHGLGDHASNSFSVDGQPITDQQSKVFSNQIPSDSIQSLEVISGAPPAEFGGKTSLVIVVTTRSGLGVTEPHGQVTTSYGSFGSVNGGFDLAYGGDKWGNYISANGLNTGRFLDGRKLLSSTIKGTKKISSTALTINSRKRTPSVSISATAGPGSRLRIPTTRNLGQDGPFNSATPICPPGQTGSCGGLGPNGQPVGSQDQRSKIGTFNIAPSWTRLINSNTVFTLGGFVRRDEYNYYPSENPFADQSPDLQFETVNQYRTLTNAGVPRQRLLRKGINNVKAGGHIREHGALGKR